MKISTISSGLLSLNDRRLDSGPYLSGAFEARVALNKLTVKKEPLHKVTKGYSGGIYNGPQFIRNYVNDPRYGVPFVTSGSILLADLSHINMLRRTDALSSRLSYLRLEENMTLISCSGTVGRMTYVRADMVGMWSSQDVLKVVPDPDKISPGYLYAYLSSKFGIPQVISGTYGAIIQHIEPNHIANLPVPIPPQDLQKKIHELIEKMVRLRAESAQGYQQATQKLLSSFGLKDPQRHIWLNDRHGITFRTKASLVSTLRALNYDPRYLELIRQIKKGIHDPLGSLCESKYFHSGIIFRRIDAEPEYSLKLVGQREAFQVRPSGRWISKKSVEGLGLVVPQGTTVIAAHGTLWETELYCRAVYATRRTAEYAFSGDFVRCIPIKEKILPGYLFAFLRSEMAFRMLRSISTGSKQQAHQPNLLWNLPIPRLGESREIQIHELVEQSAVKFDLSLELEEEAWTTVENWIERGTHG